MNKTDEGEGQIRKWGGGVREIAAYEKGARADAVAVTIIEKIASFWGGGSGKKKGADEQGVSFVSDELEKPSPQWPGVEKEKTHERGGSGRGGAQRNERDGQMTKGGGGKRSLHGARKLVKPWFRATGLAGEGGGKRDLGGGKRTEQVGGARGKK